MKGWEYSTYFTAGLRVHHFVFYSLTDYLDYLTATPISEAFARGQASDSGSEEFTRVASLEEALELCRYGWHEGLPPLMTRTEAIKRALDLKLDVVRTYHDYVGFAPDVKAYLEGSPLTMINKPPDHKERFTLYMNTSYSGAERENRIFNRGAIVIALAEVLELLGYLVDLRLFELSFVEDDVHLSEYRIKMADERVNPQKLVFPLCHPAWIRRLNFRLIETTPDLAEAWAASYGIPAETPMIRTVLGLGDNDLLIPTIDELKLEGADVLKDAEPVIELVNRRLPEAKRLHFR